VEPDSGLRHEQEGRESRGKKGGRELMEKRRGTSASLYLVKDRLADEVRSDAIPDAAGGEGGHGAAKPDGVIYRYVFNRF
jgi:hypothetical protein